MFSSLIEHLGDGQVFAAIGPSVGWLMKKYTFLLTFHPLVAYDLPIWMVANIREKGLFSIKWV